MRFLTIFSIILIILSSCSNSRSGDISVTIADQYGLAYAPLQILKEKKIIEDQIPGIKVSWVKLGNTAAIREAILGGSVDIGFMGIPPFLIGWDKGMEWKIFTGLSKAQIGLVTWRDDINILSDFGSEDRIALPQPGSIQHILLSMAAEKQLGQSDIFDNQLVTMKHPDGMSALLSKRDVVAHFTSPPYIMMELSEPDMKLVVDGKEAMGSDFTFIAGMVTDKFNSKHPEVLSLINKSIALAGEFIMDNPEEAVAILKKDYSIPEETLFSYLTGGGLEYSHEVEGLREFIDFMKAQGYLEKIPENMDEIFIEQDY
ncbi:MAG: ABC transporter substrate-binding protein [Bacteroidetes bacterium]|nr:MAG: ABC transporter substrate-binding protein [Bacteroidota bacterium]